MVNSLTNPWLLRRIRDNGLPHGQLKQVMDGPLQLPFIDTAQTSSIYNTKRNARILSREAKVSLLEKKVAVDHSRELNGLSIAQQRVILKTCDRNALNRKNYGLGSGLLEKIQHPYPLQSLSSKRSVNPKDIGMNLDSDLELMEKMDTLYPLQSIPSLSSFKIAGHSRSGSKENIDGSTYPIDKFNLIGGIKLESDTEEESNFRKPFSDALKNTQRYSHFNTGECEKSVAQESELDQSSMNEMKIGIVN